jgi:hypothetical protein
MKKFALTALILAIVPASCQMPLRSASAQSKPRTYTHSLPSAPYNEPYTGELRIWRVASSEILRQEFCKFADWGSTNIATACVKVRSQRCEIYVVNDSVLKRYDVAYSALLAHELGHCNGWSDDHPNGKVVAVSREAEVKLAPGTQTLRAYPPLVCLTPDGKEESCSQRKAEPSPPCCNGHQVELPTTPQLKSWELKTWVPR